VLAVPGGKEGTTPAGGEAVALLPDDGGREAVAAGMPTVLQVGEWAEGWGRTRVCDFAPIALRPRWQVGAHRGSRAVNPYADTGFQLWCLFRTPEGVEGWEWMHEAFLSATNPVTQAYIEQAVRTGTLPPLV
jgi:hypothetical protein